MRIAVLCHVYYYNIWQDNIEPKLSRIKQDFDLYLTVTDNNTGFDNFKANVIAKYPNAVVEQIPNVGEDVRGFLKSLRTIFSSGKEYDYVLKIHTKHETKWREDLLDTLIPNNYAYLEEVLNRNPNFIVSKQYHRIYSKPISINRKYLPQEMEMCGCNAFTTNHFSGTMFWIKFDVCKRYFNGKLNDEFFDDKYAIGSTKAHSFELLIGCISLETGDSILYITNTGVIPGAKSTPVSDNKPNKPVPAVIASSVVAGIPENTVQAKLERINQDKKIIEKRKADLAAQHKIVKRRRIFLGTGLNW